MNKKDLQDLISKYSLKSKSTETVKWKFQNNLLSVDFCANEYMIGKVSLAIPEDLGFDGELGIRSKVYDLLQPLEDDIQLSVDKGASDEYISLSFKGKQIRSDLALCSLSIIPAIPKIPDVTNQEPIGTLKVEELKSLFISTTAGVPEENESKKLTAFRIVANEQLEFTINHAEGDNVDRVRFKLNKQFKSMDTQFPIKVLREIFLANKVDGTITVYGAENKENGKIYYMLSIIYDYPEKFTAKYYLKNV